MRRRHRPRGVTFHGRPVVGRGVVFEVAVGARVTLGDGCVLGDGCRLHVRAGTVRIGAGAILGERCVLLAHAGIDVGDRCVLGDEVVLVDVAHRHDDPERPTRQQALDAAPISVGAGARLGPRAVVERGVSVPPGATVAAQTVVR
ncbi:MAG: acyltransferase [Solirubrobacteraceae bacterium]